MEITDTIIEILEEITEQKIDHQAAVSSDNLIQDFGINSLNLMHFIIKLEDKLNISIDLGQVELSMFDSVNAIEAYVVMQKGNAIL